MQTFLVLSSIFFLRTSLVRNGALRTSWKVYTVGTGHNSARNYPSRSTDTVLACEIHLLLSTTDLSALLVDPRRYACAACSLVLESESGCSGDSVLMPWTVLGVLRRHP